MKNRWNGDGHITHKRGKQMTFKDAMAKTAALAEGNYYAVRFEISVQENGTTRPECSIYIATFGWTQVYRNFEMALEDMKTIIQQKNNPQLIVEMMPDLTDGSDEL